MLNSGIAPEIIDSGAFWKTYAKACPDVCRVKGAFRGKETDMRKTALRDCDYLITVDVRTLAAMLSCGVSTARKVGKEAGARIQIGRRVLYSVDAVKKYLKHLEEN